MKGMGRRAMDGLVEKNVPTRQSYVMAMVREEERTAASGVTNLFRMAAGPSRHRSRGS